MLDPVLARKLMEDIPEIQEFRSFIAGEVLRLNELNDIKATDILSIAEEVRARQMAYDILTDILSPLIDATAPHSKPVDNKEYQV